MTANESEQSDTTCLFDRIENLEQVSLEAVRKFLDTVDGVFPDLSEDGARRKIIDSAFKITEQLVSTSTGLAKNILEVTEKALSESDHKSTSSGK